MGLILPSLPEKTYYAKIKPFNEQIVKRREIELSLFL